MSDSAPLPHQATSANRAPSGAAFNIALRFGAVITPAVGASYKLGMGAFNMKHALDQYPGSYGYNGAVLTHSAILSLYPADFLELAFGPSIGTMLITGKPDDSRGPVGAVLAGGDYRLAVHIGRRDKTTWARSSFTISLDLQTYQNPGSNSLVLPIGLSIGGDMY